MQEFLAVHSAIFWRESLPMGNIITIATGTFATLIWRILGVGIAGKIDEKHPLYEWFSHVSYASVAAILLQNLVISDGSLSHGEIVLRLVSVLSGLWVCRMRSHRVFRGLIVALGTYVVLDYSGLMAYL